MKDQLPPEAQRKYEEIEELQAEANDVVAQREQAEADLADVEAALDALAEIDPDTAAYRTVGPVRIEADHDDLAADLEAKADRLEARIDELDEEEDDLREQFENRKREIKHLLGAAGGPPGGPEGPGGPGPGQ